LLTLSYSRYGLSAINYLKITIIMASPITDPKDFAQHINEKMLADFLGIQNPKIVFNIKGEKPKGKKRISEDVVERFIQVIENLADIKRAQWLFNEMLYVNALSEQRHIANLENQANEDGIVFDIADYGKCVCHDERALWWYIHHRNVFDKYFEIIANNNFHYYCSRDQKLYLKEIDLIHTTKIRYLYIHIDSVSMTKTPVGVKLPLEHGDFHQA